MSKRYKAKRRARYLVTCQRCRALGAIPCLLYCTDRQPEDRLCPTCANLAGYCSCCGLFWAGVEAFDFNPHGLCPDCDFELKNDAGDFDTAMEDALYDF